MKVSRIRKKMIIKSFLIGFLLVNLYPLYSLTAQEMQGSFLRTIASMPSHDERGLCMDLGGWTPTNVQLDSPLNAHTCKHGWWNWDGRFSKAALTKGRLEMPFFNRCLEAVSGRLLANPCSGSKNQKFKHLEKGQIVLLDKPNLCITVASTPLIDAGGDAFWKTDLMLDLCSEEKAAYQRWKFEEAR